MINGQKDKTTFLYHNANSIYNDRFALQELLHNLHIDIALICETKLPT
jgi:hypothetical protein